MKLLHKKSALAVSIKLDNSKGTGFLFCYKGNFYVITARHVLFGLKNGKYDLYSDTAWVNCPDSESQEDSATLLDIALNDKNTYYNADFDVALIHLGTYTLSNANKNLHPTYREEVVRTRDPINRAQVFGEYSAKIMKDLHVGSDVFVVGYPTSLGIDTYYDIFDNDRPVVRKGIVSHLNHKKSHIVIDCFVFSGNSGGPVLQPNEDSEKPFSIIGLVSRYVPYRQDYYIPNENIKQTNYINSGYAMIVAMENIIGTIQNFSLTLPLKADDKDDWF